MPATMSEIGFYHLTRSTLTQALPQLLVRTLAAGQRALVLGPAGVRRCGRSRRGCRTARRQMVTRICSRFG
jgi:hypothetical protein